MGRRAMSIKLSYLPHTLPWLPMGGDTRVDRREGVGLPPVGGFHSTDGDVEGYSKGESLLVGVKDTLLLIREALSGT